MKCLGRNNEDHCCYVNSAACEFLEEHTQPGFRWSCGLRRELGDWNAVLKDPRYVNGPGAVFGPKGINCRDWPDKDSHCACLREVT